MEILLSTIPVFLLGTGFFYIFKLKGFYLLHPIRTCRSAFKKSRTTGVSPVKALTMALAGTLGVGNIVGVATALYLGGPGAVFWMVFSALIAMVLKYAEICLAVRHRRYHSDGQPEGGAPYYIKDGLTALGLPQAGRCLSAIFAALCLINTFTMGSMLQANAVAGALDHSFHIPLWVTGMSIAVTCLLVTRGGARRIAALTEKMIPLMTLGFLGLCAAVLILRHERIGSAVRDIFASAFNFSGMGGGVMGFLTSAGVRYGIMRGLVSNEAGCGTAPMAHAVADTEGPAAQGVLGLVEVFVDTVLLCTVTALAILVSDSGYQAFGEDGVRTAQSAFSSVLGSCAGWFFAISILFFGLATVLCWAHYGMTSVGAMLSGKARWRALGEAAFPWMYAASVMAGTLIAPRGVWFLADGALGIMTLLNLLVLVLMHREVSEETALFFAKSSPRRKKRVANPSTPKNNV